MLSVKSPICRIGGKAYLTRFLLEHIPEHTTYVEPFAGGAKLLFSKEPSPVEILNDNAGDLVNLYRCIQNDKKRQEMVKMLNETPYARSVFQSWKYGDKTTRDDIEKASRYFFLCKASFAGDVERGGFGMPSKGTGRNPARTFRTSISGLDAVGDRLKNVVIECLPFAEVITRYDSEGSLFYVDPPYYGYEDYYGDTFTETDHYHLADLLHSVAGKVMLSHYECDTYNQLYHDWNKFTFESFKGSYKAATGTEKPVTVECLYTNFGPVKTRGLFDENTLV